MRGSPWQVFSSCEVNDISVNDFHVRFVDTLMSLSSPKQQAGGLGRRLRPRIDLGTFRGVASSETGTGVGRYSTAK